MDDEADISAGSVAGAWGEPEPTTQPDHPFGVPEGARYERGGLLGVGGMGRVVSAHDRRLGREVALKEALPDVGAEGPSQLAREARITARLEHPGIVAVHDAGTDSVGTPWYAMPVMRGRTLRDVLGDPGGAASSSTLRHVLRACEAVAYAHSKGVVHRDLKPHNILLGEFGETQVADWGIAITADDPDDAGAAGGTPGWMAPEQERGERATARSDVWSLGAVIDAVLGDADLPEARAIVVRATAEDPAQRYPDARALADDLARFLDGRRVSAHEYSAAELVGRLVRLWRAPLTVAALSLLLIGVAVAVGWTRTTQERERAQFNLARALVQRARAAEVAGHRAHAEVLATHALTLHESPQARGVLAALGGDARPARTPAAAFDGGCEWRGVLPSGLRLCRRGGLLEARRRSDPSPVWTWAFDDPSTEFVTSNGGDLFVWAEAAQGRFDRIDPERGVAAGTYAAAGPPQYVAQSASGLLAAWRGHHFGLYDRAGASIGTTSGCDVVVVGAAWWQGALTVVCGSGDVWRHHVEAGAALERLGSLGLEVGLSSAAGFGDKLVVGATDGSLFLTDGATIVSRTRLTDHAIPEVVTSPDGLRVGARSEQGAVGVWEPSSGRLLHLPAGEVDDIAWSDRGRLLLAGPEDVAWSLPEPSPPRRIADIVGLSTVSLSPDGSSILGARGDGRVTLWTPADGERREFQVFDAVVKDAEFNHAGDRVLAVAATGDGAALRHIDLPSGEVRTGKARGAFRRGGALPDGSLMLLNWGVILYRADDVDSEPQDTGWPRGPYWDLAFAQDRRVFAVMGAGPMLRVGEATDAGPELRWSMAVDGGLGAAIHSSGRAAVGTADGVWLIEGPASKRLLQAPVLRAAQPAISPSGRLVAAGDLSGSVWIWDADSPDGRLLAELRGHRGRVSGVAFRTEDELVTGGWDGTMRRWDLRPLHEPVEALQAAADAWGLSVDAVLAAP